MPSSFELELRDRNHAIHILIARWLRPKKRILIYGAGEHTAGLFRWTNLLATNIVAIADQDPLLHTRKLWGFDVIPPDRILDLSPEVILISSKTFQDEIYDSLRKLEDRGIEVIRLYRPLPLDLWNEDTNLNRLYGQISDRTMVSKPSCHILYQLARHVRSIEGDMAEVGVYRGGTAKVLLEIASSCGKSVHLFDTFSGMPETDPERDFLLQGWLGETSEKEVRNLLSEYGNAYIYPGLFPRTAEGLNGKMFSFVHVDVDIYQSVKDCSDYFYPRLKIGGAIVYDDYGWWTCPGAKLAVDEYFLDKPEQPIYLSTGQCVVFRLPF